MLNKRLVPEDPHHLPHSVPEITGDVVQVDHPAHAGDEGNMAFGGLYMTTHLSICRGIGKSPFHY